MPAGARGLQNRVNHLFPEPALPSQGSSGERVRRCLKIQKSPGLGEPYLYPTRKPRLWGLTLSL